MNQQNNMRRITSAASALFLSLNVLLAQDIVTDTTGIASSTVSNVLEMLRGKVSGVRVSAIDGNIIGGMNINIRGINSLRTDNQPLIIVDGMTVSTNLSENLVAFPQMGEESYLSSLNPLAFLNPNDIESIEILKDVSATAIYGVKAANGVVIINTKRSAKGERNIIVSSNLGINTDASRTGLKRAGFNHNHYVAIQGESKNTGYNISANFKELSSNIARTGSNYGGLKVNFETHANKYAWFGLNALIGVGSTSSTTAVSYLGSPSYTMALRGGDASEMETWLKDYDDDSRDYRSLASTYFQLNILPSLHFRMEGGVDFQSNRRVVWYGRNTMFGAPNPDNEFGGRASNLFSQLLNYNAKASLWFNRYFASVHYVNVAAVFDVQGNSDKFNVMSGQNFFYDSLRGKGLNVGNYIPFLNKNYGEYMHIGGHLAAEYNYANIVKLNLVLRTDYTPLYKSNAVNFYPSVNAVFDIHQAFLPDNELVSALTFESGYGVGGREKMVPYNMFGRYLTGTWFTPEPTTEPFYDGLESLKTGEFHAGVRLGLLKGRIGLSAGFYARNTKDVFTMYQMGTYDTREQMWTFGPNTNFSGCESVFSRESSLRNRGFELDLSGVAIQTHDWKWTLSANISRNSNLITSSNEDDFYGMAVGKGIYTTCNVHSRPVSCFYGFIADENGDFVDVTGEGVIGNEDKVLLGNSTPLCHGGIQSVLTWQNLSFEVAIDGAGGHKIANVNALVKDGKCGPDGKITLASNYIEKGDYMRINQVGVKYDFYPSQKWIQQLSVRLSCQNLATISSYSGWNPDVNSFGVSTLSNGLDYGSFPMSRMFFLGVSVKF